MDREYITNVLAEIKNGIDAYNKIGGARWAYYPKEVLIEKDGIKIIVPFVP